MVQPGPPRPVAARRPEPGGARAVGRLVPCPGPARPHGRAPGAPQHPDGQPAQHRGPLRPGQRLLPPVPRRDADVLERGLRVRRPVAGRCPAEQVPAARRQRAAACRPARPRDRHRVGRVRALRGGRAGLPGDDDHDLERAARAGPGTRPGRRPGAPRRRPAARLPRRRGDLRRDRLDRDARGRGRRVPRDVLRDMRSRAATGRSTEPPGDHVPGCRLRAPAPGRQLDPDVHLPRWAVSVARGHGAGDP